MTFPRKAFTSPKFWMLSALYFVEGMPWGFQSKALPVFMRTQSASLTSIGLLSLLSLPWMLKILWAPLVDRYGSRSFGERKSWIVPLQAMLVLACLAAAHMARSDLSNLWPLMALVGLMNLFAATMDIAVDGLAVDVLQDEELGTGNIAQVVGYKFGTLMSGGLLVWATGDIGWPGLFLGMAAFVAVVCVLTARFREPPRRASGEPKQSMGDILGMLSQALREPGALPLFLVIATYKSGEQFVDAMFKPFLVDAGFSPQQVGLWVSTFGMGASLAGSFVGGLAASRWPLYPSLVVSAALRVIPLVGVVLLTMRLPSPTTIVAVALAENFFGGVLTTVMFAFMMSRTNKRIGATHFTLLSTVEMVGKAPIPMLAGAVADARGYTNTFGLGAILSLLYLGLLLPLRKHASRPPPAV